jgi:hypothetical protein
LAVEITPYPGDLIDTDQAATLCGVSPVTIRSWINRGYHTPAGVVKLPVARRDGRLILLNPVDVAKADQATKTRARRYVLRGEAA